MNTLAKTDNFRGIRLLLGGYLGGVAIQANGRELRSSFAAK